MSADGNWHLSVDSPMGKQEFDFAFATDGSTLTGTAVAPDGREIDPDIFAGAVDGDNLTWKVKVHKPVQINMTFKVTVDGDAINGKVKIGVMASFPVAGHRV